MSTETLNTLSTVCIVIAVISLLSAILMFFLFNVPRLINELTGRDAKKFIAEAKRKNEEQPEEKHSGTSETLLSSELVSEQLGARTVTTKLPSAEDTTLLTGSTLPQNPDQSDQNDEPALPVIAPDAEFRILEEISFTSSNEIIQ